MANSCTRVEPSRWSPIFRIFYTFIFYSTKCQQPTILGVNIICSVTSSSCLILIIVCLCDVVRTEKSYSSKSGPTSRDLPHWTLQDNDRHSPWCQATGCFLWQPWSIVQEGSRTLESPLQQGLTWKGKSVLEISISDLVESSLVRIRTISPGQIPPGQYLPIKK